MIIELLKTCKNRNIGLTVKNGKLLLKDKDKNLDAELTAQIKANKQAIIDWLSDDKPQQIVITRSEGAERYAMSYAQQRLWFVDRLEGHSSHYNIPFQMRFNGELDAKAISFALEQIAKRHQVLRSRFEFVGEQGVQVVEPLNEVVLEVEDLTALEGQAQQAKVTELAKREALKPFDLAKAQMFRCRLLKLADDLHIVLFTMHHIAGDGWSKSILSREFSVFYEAYKNGQKAQLAPLEIQYGDYANWQRQYLKSDNCQKQLNYWKNRLSHAPQCHSLMLDKPRPAKQSFASSSTSVKLSGQIHQRINAMCQAEQVTLFMFLQSAFALLLAKFSGENDIVLGVPHAGRDDKAVESLVGCFINTLAVRTQINPNLSFKQLLAQAKEHILADFEYRDIPFELLVDELKPERNLAYNPVCQIKFVLQNYQQQAVGVSDAAISEMEVESQTIRFDLDLTAMERADGIILGFSYKQELFEGATIERMAQAYVALVENLLNQIDLPVDQVSMVADKDKPALRALGTGPSDDAPLKCIHRSIAQTAAAHPARTAIISNNQHISFAELNSKANRLAHYLSEMDIGVGDRVGVCIRRSPELLLALLGVLKCGATYVPFDRNNAIERNNHMIEDGEIELMLLSGSLMGNIDVGGVDVLLMEESFTEPDWLAEFGSDEPNIEVGLNDSAYIIYTSGSTGLPKGVEITHQGLADYCRFAQNHYYANHLDGALLITSQAFDIGVPSIYVPLLTGDSVTLVDEQEVVSDLADMLLAQTQLNNADKTYLLRLTPNHLKGLLALLDGQQVNSKHVFVVGGEAFSPALAKQLQRSFPKAQIYNHYGPTETVVGCSIFDVSNNLDKVLSSVPIGKAMDNTQLYVLDKQGFIVPQGVPGELYIGGQGVAKGYIKQPELTAEKFVQDPTGFDAGRLFRTGDLVRWRHDGLLEYIGRQDLQVKIRGYRIEIGEIEQQLNRLHQVASSVVLALDKADGEPQLVAYVALRCQHEVLGQFDAELQLIDTLRQALTKTLPLYMVPQAFVLMDVLPLNANGKLDRKALPQPGVAKSAKIAYVAPRNALETALCAIWQDVLKIKQVGVQDNFFALGGDSIVSIQMVARAKKIDCHFSVRDLFEYQTIEALIPHIQGTEIATADQGTLTGTVELLPVQQAFISRAGDNPHHFNQSILLNTPAELSLDGVKAMMTALLHRHDALRLRFAANVGHFEAFSEQMLEQICHSVVVTETAQIEAHCQQIQRSLNIHQGPIIKAVLFELKPGQPKRLLLVCHHMVIDGVSWRVLLNDLVSFYQQYADGVEISHKAKTASLQQWLALLTQYAESDELQTQRSYWLNMLTQEVGHFSPSKTNEHSVDTIKRHTLVLSKAHTETLLTYAKERLHCQINELLLSALLHSYQQHFDGKAMRVDMESHGRQAPQTQAPHRFDELDVSETLGWFTVIYPLVLSSQPHFDTLRRLKEVKEQYRAIPANGLGFGVLQQLKGDDELLELDTQTKDQALLFNYLGQFDNTFEHEGVFSGARESSGDNVDSRIANKHALAITAAITAGKMNLTFNYRPALLCGELIVEFGQSFVAAINDIVELCQQTPKATLSPADFANARVSIDVLDKLQLEHPALKKLYITTPMQQGMLYHGAADKGASYTILTHCDFNGALNISAFKEAWQHIINRHDILRTYFVLQDSEMPHQLVSGDVELPFELIDLTDLAHDSQNHHLVHLRAEQKAQGFDFAKAPLMRLVLVKLADEHYQFIWPHHHILSDGWCMPTLFAEVMQSYRAYAVGDKPQLPQVTPFENYISWLNGQSTAKAQAFWQQHLADFDMPQSMRFDGNSEVVGQFHELPFKLSDSQSQALSEFAKQHKTTLNVVTQLAFALLLRGYCDSDDIVFGATLSGRPAELSGVENMIGLFINTVPVRLNLAEQKGLSELLSTLQHDNLARESYGYLGLSEIQRLSEVDNDKSLFEALLVFENFPKNTEIAGGASSRGALGISGPKNHIHSNYPLTLSAVYDGLLQGKLSYDSAKISPSIASNMLEHLQQLLLSLVPLNEAQSVTELSLLNEKQKQALQAQGEPQLNGLAEQHLVELFEHQAARFADSTAITFEQQSISYGELNRKANLLAELLIAKGVTSDTIVGLSLERSADMVVAILAILKAGGAYLALDPDLPQSRLDFILNDANPLLIVTHKSVTQQVSFGLFARLCIDDEAVTQSLTAYSGNNIEDKARTNPNDLAYIIYTSGSTGQPKGVMVEHRQVTQLLSASQGLFEFGPSDVWCLFHSISFDFSVWELWGALAFGGRLLVPSKWMVRDSERFYQCLVDEQVTIVNQTPSAFAALSGIDEAKQLELSLRAVIFGGEALNSAMLRTWVTRHDLEKIKLVNMYGITETTVHVTYKALSHDDIFNSKASLIGQALPHLGIYLLDKALNLVPHGAQGEIYVAGGGVSRGYLNRQELTQQRFIDNPFGQGKLYKTGDVAKRLGNGELSFVGRNDSQVKVRGYRIELGEVEGALLSLSEVDNGCVLVGHDANSLLAFVGLSAEHQSVTEPQLLERIKGLIPAHMVPNRFVIVPQLPLTLNGKLDRKALKQLSYNASEHQLENASTPQNSLETELCHLYEQLLGVQNVGRQDNFFVLGGHSLVATRLITQVRSRLGLELKIQALFENPTVAGLAAILATAKAADFDSIAVISERQQLPMSFAQQRMWLTHQLHDNKTLYNIAAHFALSGPFNQTAFEQSLDMLVARHESLRTNFVERSGEVFQLILPELKLQPDYHDFTEHQDKDRALEHLRASHAAFEFDLQLDALVKVAVVKLDKLQHIVLFNVHHIVCDGWSMGLLSAQFKQLYHANCQGLDNPLTSLEVQYGDFACWQRQKATEQDHQDQLSYWCEQLAGVSALHSVATDNVRPIKQSFSGKRYGALLTGESSARLQQLCVEHGVTPFMLLQSGFALLLGRYGNCNDVVMGTAASGREHPQVQDLIGMFVNTLVLRTRFDEQMSFAQLLEQNRQTILAAQQNQGIQFEMLLDALDVERSMSYSPLFQVMFDMQNNDVDANRQAKLGHLGQQNIKFDLTLTVRMDEQGIHMLWGYADALFSEQTIERMALNFMTLLEAVSQDVQQNIWQLPLIDKAEQQLLLNDWQQTGAIAPDYQHHCWHQLFEAQAAKHPQVIAVKTESQHMSFAELDSQSNQLAHLLFEKGIGEGMMVGVCLERDCRLIVAMLAIAKAGGVYVPIDGSSPNARIEHIVNDSGMSHVLTQSHLADKFDGLCTVIDISADNLLDNYQTDSLQGHVAYQPQQLAYVIYTSGSTGKPKGVLVEHGQLLSTLDAVAEVLDWQTGDVMPCLAANVFDISLLEMLMPLLGGGTVNLLTKEAVQDIDSLLAQTSDANVFHAVPSLMRIWLDEVKNRGLSQCYPQLKTVLVGGEAVPKQLLVDLMAGLPGVTVIELYGPTEAAMVSTFYLPQQQKLDSENCIGRPFKHVKTYVLDKHKQLLPIGAVGELYIAGPNVARGYHGLESLTEQKFGKDIVDCVTPMYASGDLARFLPCGQLEYMGRADQQIKIRGFRVEPGEIEGVMLSTGLIKACSVILHSDGSQKDHLVAYAVANDESLESSAFIEQLKPLLPDYMVPSHIALLAELPLNANGKLDKKALPAIDLTGVQQYVAPTNEIESALAELFVELLKVEQVGLLDNFFALGGDSIIAIQLVAKAKARQLHFTVQQLFEHQTIAAIAPFVSTKSLLSIEQTMASGQVFMTQAQQHFFAMEVPERHHFNQSVLLKAPQDFDFNGLEKVISAVYQRHDALRLRFAQKDNDWQAEFVPLSAQLLSESVLRIDLSHLKYPAQKAELEARCEQLQRSLDFSLDPSLDSATLFKAVWFDFGDAKGRLLLVCHHLVVDGVSWRILLGDIETAYGQYIAGSEIVLADKTSSVKHFGEQLQHYLATTDLTEERHYWLERLALMQGHFPYLLESTSEAAHRRDGVSLNFDRVLTDKLLTNAGEAYRTHTDELLLTALIGAWQQWSSCDSLRINLESHGRSNGLEQVDVSETVGWFTAIYPMVLSASDQQSLAGLIKSVKEQVRAIPEEGFNYGLLKHLSKDTEIAELDSKSEAYGLTFNYLGQFDNTFNDAGLFSAASESAGASMSEDFVQTDILAVNAKVIQGQLRLAFNFDATRLDKFVIEQLAALYQQHLTCIIEHCCAMSDSQSLFSDEEIEMPQDGQGVMYEI